ncbi:MAG: GDP-mannose 4,6-dehydratase, partial [Candidatus Nanopelagicales bacterium]|nr:GDP-mannose 4,6-dehydratase [Candidatus Nanopelagicales bacterium]
MKILLTGGAGFIGSHLAEKLISEGHSVTALDNLSTGSSANLDSLKGSSDFKLVEASMLDKSIVDQLVADSDGVIHLGAALGVQRILERPYESFIANTQGTENLIIAAAESKKKIFIASTSEIYGKNPEQPLNEESDRVIGSPKLLRWAYSEAKAIDESLAQMFAQSHGLSYVVGRFFNTVGPRQSGMYGMVLPRFVSAALKGEALEVHGDGLQTRTFCHVLDSIDAVVRLFLSSKAIGEAFNIGGEGEISIKDLAQKVIDITGSKSEIKYISYQSAYPQGFDEMMRRVPDTSKLRSYTGWSPKRNLDEIINDIQISLKS